MNQFTMSKKRTGIYLLTSLFAGLLLAYADVAWINQFGQFLIDLFSRFLRFISIPIIFLSVTTAISNTEVSEHRNQIFSRTVFYVLLTTMIAAFIAIMVYLLLSPAQLGIAIGENLDLDTSDLKKYLIEFMPDNLFRPFMEGNVFAVVLMAFAIGFLTHGLEKKHSDGVKNFFNSFFHLFMRFALWIIHILPLVLWAFVLVFVRDMKSGAVDDKMYFYIAAIMIANFLQAFVVLPIFLKAKGLPVFKTVRGMTPALLTAFFSKSSSATLPITLNCVQQNLKARKDVSSFTIPLCTTINMNACAAFIYITVIFVAQSSGIVFTGWDYIFWFFLSIVGAIGNAGVPMGCYFMASAFVISLGAPTYLLSLILPFYLLLDMFETAINVWSDSCITLAVSKDIDDKAKMS